MFTKKVSKTGQFIKCNIKKIIAFIYLFVINLFYIILFQIYFTCINVFIPVQLGKYNKSRSTITSEIKKNKSASVINIKQDLFEFGRKLLFIYLFIFLLLICRHWSFICRPLVSQRDVSTRGCCYSVSHWSVLTHWPLLWRH